MRTTLLALTLLLALPGCKRGPGTDDTGAVDHGPIVGVGLSPYNPTLQVGEEVRLYAEGFYEDGHHVDLDSEVEWLATEPRVATVSDSGLVQAEDEGSGDVIATYGDGVSAKVTVTVKGAGVSVTGYDLTPMAVQLLVDDSAQLTVTASYSDGSAGNVSGSCEWASSDAGIVEALSSGRIRGEAVGQADVGATCAGIDAGSASVTVEEEDVVLPEADLEVRNMAGSATGSGDVELRAQVFNVGTGYASGFWVQAFLDSATEPTDPNADDAYTWLPGLGAGEHAAVTLVIEDPGPGTYQSWLVADLLDEVQESGDRNNYAGPVTVEIEASAGGPPNLVLTSMDALGDPTLTLYEITVTNQGETAAGPFWIDLWYTPADIPEAGPDTMGDDFTQVPGLAPGASFSWEPEVGYGPSTTGEWYSCVLADSMADVDETEEDDNVECVDVEVW